MESTVGLQWAYSNKRQVAYQTANPDIDINQSHPFEGADFADHSPNLQDNAAMFGKGHEFAERQEILSWDVKFRRSFVATSKMCGWSFAFHLGKITTTVLGGSPAAYQHVMEYQDPNGVGYYGSGRQQPAVTIIERVTSGLARRFPSNVVTAVELTGAQNDFARLAVELQGSGFKNDASAFVFPASSEGNLFRTAALLFQTGLTGGLADVSCDIRSFRFRSEMSYAEADGYCPGSGYLVSGDPTSGQIRNKLEFLRRAVVLEFVVKATSSNTYFTRLEGSIETAAVLTLTGSLISGVNSHKVSINIPRLKYKAIPIGADGDVIIYTIQAVVFYDAGLQNPFEVTVVNDVPSYLVSS
jgi:hypothetical protein